MNYSSGDLRLLDIMNEMQHQGLESSVIISLRKHCQSYEGLRDLMEMWLEETDPKEREKLIAALQESLDDIENAPQ